MKKKNNDVRRRLIECYLVSSFLLGCEIGLDSVALVLEATLASSTGNFET